MAKPKNFIRVRNITAGPKAATRDGVEVWADPGKSIEVDADDYPADWFQPAEDTEDTVALDSLDLNGLVREGVRAGLFPSATSFREQLTAAILRAREGEGDDFGDDLTRLTLSDEEAADADEDETGKPAAPAADDVEPPTDAEILAAVNDLEADNDEHWTVKKLPQVDAVAAALAYPKLTRADITRAAKDVVRPEPKTE